MRILTGEIVVEAVLSFGVGAGLGCGWWVCHSGGLVKVYQGERGFRRRWRMKNRAKREGRELDTQRIGVPR